MYLSGGGGEHYADGVAHSVYAPNWRSKAVLAKVSSNPVRYERRLPDGGMQVFTQSDGVVTPGRRVYLTDIIDPQGLTVHLTYDASLRLVAVTDAIGLVTTLSYELASDPLKITKISDPYGRFARLTYNASGQLASITDAINLTSSLMYGDNDFVQSLTTPYGTTLFTHETSGLTTTTYRFIQAIDPLGGTERVEFRWSHPDIPATAPASQVPTDFSAYNNTLDHYNSVYWDKRAMQLGAGDVTKATITHWLLYTYQQYVPFLYSHAFSVSVPHSVKKPLENRVWYAYPDQDVSGLSVGSFSRPTKTARVLDDGTSQISQAAYNTQGQLMSHTDPVGRQTSYTYAANGVDLVQTRQTTSGANDVLSTFANYNGQHQPEMTTDAAGQTTTVMYNAAGQPLTVTNARQETSTYAYDTEGRVLTVTAPMTGATMTMTYDGYGRRRTVTNSEGYTVTTEYDAFDRPTAILYPDGTAERITYDRLDVKTWTDRLGRVTRYLYDSLRRLVVARDPGGRTITKQWCTCGALDKLIDANDHATSWERDVKGRVTREVRADGVTATQYQYEATTSRLKSLIDPKGQLTTYTYSVDDALAHVAFSNAEHPTPSVSYTYDPTYARLTTMDDGTGTTQYAYKPAGTLGALQVASVDGPLPNDIIDYSYDELGRVVRRAINGVGLTLSYDALGRATDETNVLGHFTTTYVGTTRRPETVTYPNGQTSNYAYYSNTGDHRLQTIHHRYPTGATLSKFDYTYDATGNISSWMQQADDASPTVYQYGYDLSGQLTSAVHTTADLTTTLKRYAYAYDPGGNRLTEQIDDVPTASGYDRLNRLVTQQSGGSLRIRGEVNEPARITINGRNVTLSATMIFDTAVTTTTGTNTVTVAATDGSGNQASSVYQVDASGAAKTFTYDANGNLTADGARSFEWDARNQLVAITVGTHRSEFTYDGQQRRVREIEKENNVIQSDIRVLWCDAAICEERTADGTTVTRRVFVLGEQVAGVSTFLTEDHLGNVRDATDSNNVLLARYAYDPWGRRTLVAGIDSTRDGFTGHRRQSSAAVWLTQYRAYDEELGRWISEDPAGFTDGVNRYRYVRNAPLSNADPDGLVSVNLSIGKIQRYGDLDSLVRACNGRLGIGCTTGRVLPQCGCFRDGCDGKWRAQASISLSITVNVWDSSPKWSADDIIGHEMQHVNFRLGVLKERVAAGEALEAQRFGSESRCKLGCTAWVLGTYWAFWNDWTDVTNPHPNPF